MAIIWTMMVLEKRCARREDLEQQVLLRSEMLTELDIWNRFVDKDRVRLDGLRYGSNAGTKGYEIIRQIREKEKELMQDTANVEVLKVGLEADLPVTLAMLGVQVWWPLKKVMADPSQVK